MENRVSIVDYTINEALRLGVKFDNIKSIISDLQKYFVETIDVDLRNVEKNFININDVDFINSIRCVVGTSLEKIALVEKMGFHKIVLTWQHHSTKLCLEELTFALSQIKVFSKEIYLCIENASDFSPVEMENYWSIVEKYKIKRFIYKDQNSNMDSFKTFENLNELQKKAPCSIEFLASNAYGLATANSLAAYRCGVRYIGTSIGGVGLNGCAAMEEVLMALKHLWKQEQIADGSSLAMDCSKILSYMGVELPVDKAIIGKDVFAHESGIHVDGIAKNPLLYEVIKPEEVGLTRRLIIGKHSGTASIKFKFLQWNLNLNQMEAVQLLEEVKEIAITQKSPLSDCQLKQLYKKKSISNQC